MRQQYISHSAGARLIRQAVYAAAAALMLAGCGTAPPAVGTSRPAAAVADDNPLALAALARQARILDGETALQCVPYAREISGVELYGDAGTWWNAASGRYDRSHKPQPGAVLVFRPTKRSVGHLAVVTQIAGPRLIVASHANWLNNGRIHEGTPIEDVSAKGDWSRVRVWYTPGASWGGRKYATAGFILPKPLQIASRASR